MAAYTRYVDAPSGAGSTDGTSLANAYGSIADVINESTPPWGAGDTLTIELHGGTDTPGGEYPWTFGTDSTSVQVKESTYKIDADLNYDVAVDITGTAITVEGDYALHVTSSAANSSQYCVRTNNSGTTTFSKGLVVTGDCATIAAVVFGNGTVNVNNLVIAGATSADGCRVTWIGGAPTVTINHGTITDSGAYGLRRSSGTVNAKNVYCGNNTTADFNGTISQTTCASSDTTADGTTYDSITWNTTNFESITTADIDIGDTAATWGVPTAASTLQDNGTDVSVSTDYKGATRDASPNIGAVESAASTTTPFYYRRHIGFSYG